ncbi:diguanylate cyclase [Hydrogenovibrio sp. JE_KL2]|uniref:sensor domain-containing diguanylate cyclase n=1 Tax=Hydrogenovibrio sp. JE_KL2 TaxID=2651188 RepID=UPI00128CBA12|nr:diguanylate cyclase [Hydrogenovibrio sp. JE_KL2]MPQ76160.1 diguanylate cyclase [Hydrogenovibrio sp. JE_KL2]
MNSPPHYGINKTWLLIGLLLSFAFFSRPSFAQPQHIDWQLYSVNGSMPFDPSNPEIKGLRKVDGISLVGGHYLYVGNLSIDQTGDYVVDFKNTTTIDRFSFYIYDQQNNLIASANGGIGSKAFNLFFLRHGRMFDLKAGHYKLMAEVSSPYFIAQPVPYIETLSNYQQEIKLGDAIVLIGIGVFLALGIYYGALSFASSRKTELFYAIFIFSNLIFNAGAHLIFAQMLNWHNFYLVSFPILISNFFYVLFVMRLLEIHPLKNKRLYTLGVVGLVLLAIFAMFALMAPNWINEMARYGVWVFLLYGFIAGISRARQGSVVARLYLVALVAFISLASMATLPTQLSSNTIDVEHYGLAAIALEAILLALTLTYRVGELYRERLNILNHLDHNKKLAHTDSLTQIPNRYSLEMAFASMGPYASLTYIDMDNLKFYNDRFGHAKGDEMLSMFAKLMQQILENSNENARIFRVGGDEFAIISQDGNEQEVRGLIDQVVDEMRATGFDHVGVSSGAAFMNEVTNSTELKHLADIRMYENKYRRKKELNKGR